MTAHDGMTPAFYTDEIEFLPAPAVVRPRQSDADIERAVRRTLDNDPWVPSERIRCSVKDGVVTLEGGVDFWSEREAAAAVRNLEGVRGLINRLVVANRSVDEL